MKNIFKEIFIMVLLCIAIILVLAVVFYEYNPMNKEIPNPVAYKMPEELNNVENELETPLSNENEQVIRTYELTEDDLEEYEGLNYDAGKVNPFEKYSEDTTNNVVNSNTVNTDKTNTNSTGTFFENGSTK
mgnify:CR=1 FL=1